jgi:hypothetical protein
MQQNTAGHRSHLLRSRSRERIEQVDEELFIDRTSDTELFIADAITTDNPRGLCGHGAVHTPPPSYRLLAEVDGAHDRREIEKWASARSSVSGELVITDRSWRSRKPPYLIVVALFRPCIHAPAFWPGS